jgi:hypothetical protein
MIGENRFNRNKCDAGCHCMDCRNINQRGDARHGGSNKVLVGTQFPASQTKTAKTILSALNNSNQTIYLDVKSSGLSFGIRAKKKGAELPFLSNQTISILNILIT